MLKFSVCYPYADAAQFDTDYYLEKHVPLVRSALQDFGLNKIEVTLGQSGMMNQQPNFIAIANLYFADTSAMANALKTKGSVLMADIKNFTDITPLQEIALIKVTD